MRTVLRPLADHVVLKRDESGDKTPGGIVIPDTSKEKLNRGRVLSVGPGKDSKPLSIEEGQTVLFGKYAGNEVSHEGETLIILREDDVLAVVE